MPAALEGGGASHVTHRDRGRGLPVYEYCSTIDTTIMNKIHTLTEIWSPVRINHLIAQLARYTQHNSQVSTGGICHSDTLVLEILKIKRTTYQSVYSSANLWPMCLSCVMDG